MIDRKGKLVFYWLAACTIAVLIMVLIGGATRLTNSGLSITYWKPITGVLPPLNEDSWNIEFSKYKQSPEFIHINSNMDIQGFKKIFWLEYIHRLAGRIVGVIFFIPLFYLIKKGYFSTRTKWILLTVSILGICQGFMGWYMVKSGLVDSPYVSHFKLTLHLLFALSIFTILLNEALYTYYLKHKKVIFNNLFICCFSILILQIALGGLVAGLDAGMVYNQFPLMGKNLWPEEILKENFSNFLNNNAIVQFFHRINAYVLLLSIFYLCVNLFKKRRSTHALIIIGITSLQFLLGVLTIIYSVPLVTALMHQIFAFILASSLIISYWSTAK